MHPKIRLIISIVTGIVIYLIPAALWFFEDLSGAMLMFLYTVESVVTVILAVACVLILAPRSEEPKQGNYATKSSLLKTFLMISTGFMAAALLFVSLFVFLVLREKFDLESIRFALTLIVGFQVAEFISNLLLLMPMSLKQAEFFLSDSLGGTAFIVISVLIGTFLAMFSDGWFVLPFLIFYPVIVIGLPIQYFWKGGEQKGVEIEPPVITVRSGKRR